MRRAGSDYIYFKALIGITGSRSNQDDTLIRQKIEMIKRTDMLRIIKFGINDSSDIKKALSAGNGFVIGTEAVIRQNNLKSFMEYLESLKA